MATLRDKDHLVRQHHTAGLSCRESARRIGVSASSVSARRAVLGLRTEIPVALAQQRHEHLERFLEITSQCSEWDRIDRLAAEMGLEQLAGAIDRVERGL